MVKLAKKLSSGSIGDEVVGRRAAEHREKANGIDEACQEDRPFGNTCSDAHQHGRTDYTGESARNVYDSVCRERAASMLGGRCCGSSQQNPSRELRRLVSS